MPVRSPPFKECVAQPMTFGPALQPTRQEPFELKGSLFTLTVLRLRDTDIDAVDRLLAEKAAQAPGFFNQAPVVLELDALPGGSLPDLATLRAILLARGMVPVGVRNASEAQQASALAAGLAVLPEGRQTVQRKGALAPAPRDPNRLITQPVRSGQQLFAPEGDLIVTGAVSPGAELLAVGNIHIYGVLRGRALAGVKGDAKARIFCQNLEAELVSVAGHYRVIEELGPDVRGRSVQVMLVDGRLVIEPLGRPG